MLKRTTDIKIRYALFVTGVFILAVAVYLGVDSAAENDIQSRLEAESLKIETVIASQLDAFLTSLYGARAIFDEAENMSPAKFRRFVEKAETMTRFPGLRAIVVYEVFSGHERPRVEAKIRMADPQAHLKPGPAKSNPFMNFSAVTLVEPLDRESRHILGLDVLTDPERSFLIHHAFNSGRAVLTGALKSLVPLSAPGRFMHIYMPLTRPHGGRLRPGDRWLGASFRVQDFFQKAFGMPSLLSEKVNWRITSLGQAVYDRFDAPESHIDHA